jgi:hypothetical protein
VQDASYALFRQGRARQQIYESELLLGESELLLGESELLLGESSDSRRCRRWQMLSDACACARDVLLGRARPEVAEAVSPDIMTGD